MPSVKVYSESFEAVFNEEIDWDTDTIQCLLFTTAPSGQHTHKYLADVLGAHTEHSTSGTGYARVTLAGKTLANTSGTVKFDADDVVFTSAASGTITARFAALVDTSATGADATRPVLAYVDFDSNQTASNGGTLTIAWHATNGIATITVS